MNNEVVVFDQLVKMTSSNITSEMHYLDFFASNVTGSS